MSVEAREATVEQASPTFEEAMKELDSIVNRLEKGDLPLDDSLAAFQRGVELARVCGRQLDEAERKIELLTTDKDDHVTLRPFDDGSAAKGPQS